MATRIIDSDGNRVLSVDANNEGSPGSVFVSGPRGFCMEFDLVEFVSAIKCELGIIETLEVSLERFMQFAA